jgi:hypothetical protein
MATQYVANITETRFTFEYDLNNYIIPANSIVSIDGTIITDTFLTTMFSDRFLILIESPSGDQISASVPALQASVQSPLSVVIQEAIKNQLDPNDDHVVEVA